MKTQYDPELVKKLKGLNVRIRNSFKKRIVIFEKNPFNPQLNNHALQGKLSGYRSISITADYRAMYEEVATPNDKYAYFVFIGTHKELYS